MKRKIAASLTILLWAVFTYIGYDLTLGVARRHVPGFPNAGLWHYYVHFPLAILIISIALLLLARRLATAVFVAIWVLQLVALILFFLGYTGGV
jgi:hypothetical protein